MSFINDLLKTFNDVDSPYNKLPPTTRVGQIIEVRTDFANNKMFRKFKGKVTEVNTNSNIASVRLLEKEDKHEHKYDVYHDVYHDGYNFQKLKKQENKFYRNK